jgi:hypothetical protein
MTLSKIPNKPWTQMTREELKKEALRCKEDKPYFIRNYIKVEHQLLGLVSFDLFPFQEKIINELDHHRFNILRKFRQAGCTTIACAYALHIIVFQKNKTVTILSMGDAESTEALSRIKIMYEELPPFLKPEITRGGDNKHNLQLVTGSKVKARPAKKTSGRSLAAYLLILDEAAFIENIQDIWTAAAPTISTGGRVFMLSTVNGMGNFFYQMWDNAIHKLNEFNPIDIIWTDHPQYHYNSEYEHLYAELKAKDPNYDVHKFEKAMQRNIGVKRWRQEYLAEFLGTGDTYIDGETLTLLNENANREYWINYNNRMRIWKEPEPHFTYVMGVDVSLGRERDYSAFHVINLYDGEQVCEFYSNKTPLDEFASIVNDVGKQYNLALIVPERNTIGLNLIENLIKKYEYENVYMDDAGSYGFQTTQQSKAYILGLMEEYVRTKKVNLNSERTVKELLTFIIDESGKPIADAGQNDDLVISLALTCFGANYLISNKTGLITKLNGNAMYDPLTITKGISPKSKRPEWGNKTWDEIKWVLEN